MNTFSSFTRFYYVLIVILVCCLGAQRVNSQSSPQRFSYQAIIRNEAGQPIINQSIGINLSIRTISSVVYTELHYVSTNGSGLVSLQVGGGSPVLGSFNQIEWSSGRYFIETEIDPEGGNNYSINGISELLSVPYALYANDVKIKDKIINLGTNSSSTHEIPANTDLFITGDGLWNPIIQLPVPRGSNNFLSARKNSVLTILCNSSFAFRLLKNNSDLSEALILRTGETALFLYDGTKWRLINYTRGYLPSTGSEGQTLTMCGGVPTWGPCLPRLTTTKPSSISPLSAISGGNISYIGPNSIDEYGVVWSLGPEPTINLPTKTSSAYTGNNFTSNISGLLSNKVYYLRAYATTSSGTAYGDEIKFSTGCVDGDGNIYSSDSIGTQVWMKENLKTKKYRNGDLIPQISDSAAWTSTISGGFSYYGNDSASNNSLYGKLYNSYALTDSRGLCPLGWHIPSYSEWLTLQNFLGGNTSAGGKMKSTGNLQAGTGLWQSPNTGASNESGFSGHPGGMRGSDGNFMNKGFRGSWWMFEDQSVFYNISLSSSNSNLITNFSNNNSTGYSIRCLKD